MKLLLTSGGFTNSSIANALLELTGKPFNQLKLAFIPTAANAEEGDKSWVQTDIENCRKLGFSTVDVVDISALEKEEIKNRLSTVDVLMFGGGNTYYLMSWIKKSGVQKLLPEFLKTKIYVGISAGSMVATPALALSQTDKLYYEGMEIEGLPEEALGLVNFQIRPHLNSSEFPNVTIEKLEELAKEIKDPIYAIDDNTAIKVDGEAIFVVTEGEWKKFN